MTKLGSYPIQDYKRLYKAIKDAPNQFKPPRFPVYLILLITYLLLTSYILHNCGNFGDPLGAVITLLK